MEQYKQDPNLYQSQELKSIQVVPSMRLLCIGILFLRTSELSFGFKLTMTFIPKNFLKVF